MKNEELTALRGGYGTGWWYCFGECWGGDWYDCRGPVYYPNGQDISEILAVCSSSYGTCYCCAPA